MTPKDLKQLKKIAKHLLAALEALKEYVEDVEIEMIRRKK